MQKTLELLRPNKNATFPYDSLMGSLGQAVIETQLRSFGYEVYPYIYENNRVEINGSVRRGYSSITTPKIRSMPDLHVFDREVDKSYLLHVKTTFGTGESGYWINKSKFDSYKQYWPDAFLTIYFISTATIRCCKIGNIRNWTKTTSQKITESSYHLNMQDFSDLPRCFPRIKRQQFCELSRDIRDFFKLFGNARVK